jgi:hypothetical protein
MHEVVTTYKRKDVYIKFRHQLPEAWEDLSDQEKAIVFRLLYRKGLTRQQLRVKLLEKLAFRKAKFVLRAMDPEVVYELSECMQFVFTEACPLALKPFIRHQAKRYYLPDGYLHNATFIEFMYADAFLEQIAKHQGQLKDCEALDKLVAVLCRPGKWFWNVRKYGSNADGDRRQRFNADNLAHRAKALHKLPMAYKMYVLNFFIGCKQAIINEYPGIFPKKKRKELSEEQGSSWQEMLKDIASTSLYGNYDQTAYYNLHTILANLEDDIKRSKKLK